MTEAQALWALVAVLVVTDHAVRIVAPLSSLISAAIDAAKAEEA